MQELKKMPRPFIRLHCILFVYFAFAVLPASGANEPFAIGDYFKLQKITELALSSDGKMMAYAVETRPLAENKTIRTVFVSTTAPGARAERIDAIQNARSFAWLRGAHELAYLSSVNGITQVFSIDPKTGKKRRHTRGGTSVTAFRFAPDGSSLAWLTQSSEQSPTLYDRLFHSDDGVVIDPEHTVVYQFVNPKWPNAAARSSNELWLKRAAERDARRVKAPGKVRSFYWSSDAKFLSVSYADREMPHVALFETYTSLGIFDAGTEEFKVVARGRTPSGKDGGLIYSGGEWIPGEHKLFIRRTQQEDRWSEKMQWSIVDLADNGTAVSDLLLPWRPMANVYGYNPEPAFLPVSETKIYSERVVRARPSLYEITPAEPKKAGIFEDVEGAATKIRFSADYETAIFVNENLYRPPEIYIWQNGDGATQLTHLNNEIAAKQMPRAREVHWQSKDGATVQGWLLEPVGETADRNNKPWPLITAVHGGPKKAVSNEFASLMSYPIWPYPFETLALNGAAVFFPNYRGTGTFGYDFQNPGAIDGEPVDDIITGIDYLIAEGIADPARLAISGHSHGGWLASLVMTKAKYFKAASFGDASLNMITNYQLMPGWLNRDVHDIQSDASLYDDPARYLELSPDMHFKGLNTATLFEAGAESLAINMLGSHKAAVHAGMPAEFVVYPKTGHGPSTPQMQYESAQRNLDWMRFWLLGKEDLNPEKAAQYERWRNLRSASELAK